MSRTALPLPPRLIALLSTGHRLLFDHPYTPAILAGAFLAVATGHVLNLTFLHDEGIFTFDLAGTMRHSFVATVFLLKAKPVLVLLYAPFSFVGLTAYLMFHAALASAAILLVTATARRLKIAHPNVAGWLLAVSMGYAVAASNGFANADGAFFLSLFFFLYFSNRRIWAAILMGMLPFVRNELALVWVAFLVWDLWKRKDYRFVIASLGFPLVYTVAGAVYHRDLFWLVATFPNPQGKPSSIGFTLPSLGWLGQYLQKSLLINFGFMGFLALLGWQSGDRRSIFLYGLTCSIFVLMTVFQFFGVFGFDTSLRYHVGPLPLVALVTAYAVSSGSRRPYLAVAALSGLLLLFPAGRSPYLVAVLAAAACRFFVKGDEFRKPADLVIWLCALVFAVIGLGTTEFGRRQHLGAHRTLKALKDSGIYKGQRVYTDIHIARYDRCSGVRNAYFLANESIVWELDRFVNKENGQYEDLVRALARRRFLIEIENHTVQRNAVYLLREGERMRRWKERIERHGPRRFSLGKYRVYYWPEAKP